MSFKITILVLVTTIAFSSCSLMKRTVPKRVVKQKLTSEEVKEPPGRSTVYGINMNLTSQVKLPSLKLKPVVKHKIDDLNLLHSFENSLVDAEGGVWFSSLGTDFFATVKLTRLGPDGDIYWKKTIADLFKFRSCDPVLVSQNAVVCSYTTLKSNNLYNTVQYLECYDYDGKLMWRTQPVESIHAPRSTGRISNDRIILPVIRENKKTNRNDYFAHIYSLSDGELLETIEFPKWALNVQYDCPIELPGGGWLFFQHGEGENKEIKYLVRYRNDMSVAWKLNTQSKYMDQPPIITEDENVLFGGRAYFAKINLNTGAIIWKIEDGKNFIPCGITPEGNFVVRKSTGRNEIELLVLNENGEQLWSLKRNNIFSGGGDTVIYNDGNILFGHSDGLTLANADGIVWEVTLSDLGYLDKKCSTWCINPTEDDSLVVFCRIREKEYSAGSTQVPLFILSQQ